MDALFRSTVTKTRPDHDDERNSDERLTYVERELNGLRRKLDDLLSFIRADDMAPLTPPVRPHNGHQREDRS